MSMNKNLLAWGGTLLRWEKPSSLYIDFSPFPAKQAACNYRNIGIGQWRKIMSAAIDCYNDLKYLSYQFKDDGMTHCQRLDHLCRMLGFNNRHHFEQKIAELPDAQIGKYSTKLML
ncbi:hypothetical protein [Pseudomonas aeruginosa]|uniref:hypothetical protein n=1 Tax=Pseudomonas aeruginosa TaxID=287 RepID=UPI0039670E7E